MNGHFTSEIGRMRNNEMVEQGLRNQMLNSVKRSEKAERRTHRPVRHHRRILVTAVLSSLFVGVLSSTAFAYPATAGGGAGRSAHEVVANLSTQPHVTNSIGMFGVVALLAVACAVVLGVVASRVGRVAHS